jgi:HTH-like domain
MERQLPVAVVCRVLGASRSTVYARRQAKVSARPGPVTSISDPDLLELIGQVLVSSPFAGEGYRKLRARLRREHGVHVSGKRVLRLLRREGCWRRSGSVAAVGRVRTTARSSLTGRTSGGHGRHHGPDPQRRMGMGVCLGGSLHRRGVGVLSVPLGPGGASWIVWMTIGMTTAGTTGHKRRV